MAEYGCACRMAPFFSAAKYMIGPFFQQKVYNWPHFSGLVYERPHFSDVSRYMHIFFIQRFFEAACSLVFNEQTAIFVYLPAINGYKNQRTVYEWVNIADDLVL